VVKFSPEDQESKLYFSGKQ